MAKEKVRAALLLANVFDCQHYYSMDSTTGSMLDASRTDGEAGEEWPSRPDDHFKKRRERFTLPHLLLRAAALTFSSSSATFEIKALINRNHSHTRAQELHVRTKCHHNHHRNPQRK